MASRHWPAWDSMLLALAWLVWLALLPWWLGLPLLVALVASLLLPHRLVGHVWLLRRGLRLGMPGVLFALQRALGGDAFAWGAALLGALVGYTLLAGLDAWLDRDVRRAPAAEASAGWPELALAPIGPAAEIIELQLPRWQLVTADLTDPYTGHVEYRDGSYWFADGTRIEHVGSQAAFSPDGHWFVVRMHDDRGIVLWDREHGTLRRLPGWQLCGWHREPWLSRREEDMPLALHAVLGQDDGD